MSRYMTLSEKYSLAQRLLSLRSTSPHNSEPPSGRTREKLAARRVTSGGRAFWMRSRECSSSTPRRFNVYNADGSTYACHLSRKDAIKCCQRLNRPR
jgi:hypothetical protein